MNPYLSSSRTSQQGYIKMSEQKTQKKIIDHLKNNGYSVFKTIATNRRGIADIIACSPEGRFVAIEVKFGSNKASELQKKYINEVLDNKGIAFVAYSLEDVLSIL